MKKPSAPASPAPAISPFCAAIDATPTISGNCKPGLRAVSQTYKACFQLDASALGSSLDIDKSLKKADPNDNRWDYAIEYRSRVLFVEVHSASGESHATKMIAKAAWLRAWLREEAPALAQLDSWRPLVWVNFGKVDFLDTTTVKRRLAQNGIVGPVRPLTDAFIRKELS